MGYLLLYVVLGLIYSSALVIKYFPIREKQFEDYILLVFKIIALTSFWPFVLLVNTISSFMEL